ncbi:hypothetical protein A1O1_04350 [Capronia coronata CBS 617.96]|uniref:Uncharacterized protein n=1 Tax=Capronia coronata CBS 617.96 TaxID=1182541 RepID=W9YNI2_9EURO|nr:uncharacterized protein A1O1_04350 [Capronia coronata CBS 617.96]EXJ91240.1 hypothetical protein A1O1_04350 [Capronia coronata CBS 617.96]
MSSNKRARHFDRSKIAPLKEQTYLFAESRLTRRQGPGRPVPPSPELDDISSDEDDSVTDDEQSDEEGEAHNINPFDPGAAMRSTSSSISQTTSTADNPFIPQSTVTGSASRADQETPSYSATSAATGTGTVTTSTTTLDRLPQVATNAASTNTDTPNPTLGNSKSPYTVSAIVIASVLAAVSVAAIAYILFRYCTRLRAKIAIYRGRKGQRLSEEEDGTSGPLGMSQANHPGVADVLGEGSVWLNNSSSTIATTPAPAYTRERERERERERDVATTLPSAPTRAQAVAATPVQKQKQNQKQKQDEANDLEKEDPFADQASLSLSRSNSSGTMRSVTSDPRPLRGAIDNDIANPLPTYSRAGMMKDPPDTRSQSYGTTDNNIRSHPGGLTNNPPTVVILDRTQQPRPTTPQRPAAVPSPSPSFPPRQSIPVPVSTSSSISPSSRSTHPAPAHPDTTDTTPASQYFPLSMPMTLPIPKPMPLPLHVPLHSPNSYSDIDPTSAIESPRSQYQPRMRKSITPSESVSNAPWSPLPLPLPFPFPIDLMPPALRAPAPAAAFINSRWSQNSSSINGRTTTLTNMDKGNIHGLGRTN